MTTIAENTGVITLISVFTVEPSNQQKLVDILARATDAEFDPGMYEVVKAGPSKATR